MSINVHKFRQLSGLWLGLFTTSLSQGIQAADLAEKIGVGTGTDNLITTHKNFDNFTVEIKAHANVNVSNLLQGLQSKNGSVNEIAFNTVSNTIDAARSKEYPDEPIILTITHTGAIPKSTSQYVDIYKQLYYWNVTTGYNGTPAFAYNYYVNTVTCFANIQSGQWAPGYQKDSVWTYTAWLSTGARKAWTASGYDSYKGCWWQGKANYNKGDFVIYMYN